MTTDISNLGLSAPVSGTAALWAGRVLSGLTIAFMAFDTAIKLAAIPQVATSMTELGYPVGQGFTIGLVELTCLVLYAWPRTAILGAILLTGVFGGAVAAHMRVGDPLLSHTLFGVYLGFLAWGACGSAPPGCGRSSPFQAGPEGDRAMRYMTFVMGNTDYECGRPPPDELYRLMDEYMKKVSASGALIDAGGLKPSRDSIEVKARDGVVTVKDGPFAEAKEVIGGYAILEAATGEELLAMVREFVDVHIRAGVRDVDIQIRPMSGGPDEG